MIDRKRKIELTNGSSRFQRGFAFLPLLLANWQLTIVLILGTLVLILGTALKVQTARLDSVKAEYSLFVNSVRVKGEEAEKAARTKEAQDKKLKESVDRENQKLRTANAALSRSLRESRSRGGYVPAPGPGSASPDRATFDRAELERALQRLDEGVSGLIEQGDQAVIDLDSAKSWAQGR